jgi:hypothetical protein
MIASYSCNLRVFEGAGDATGKSQRKEEERRKMTEEMIFILLQPSSEAPDSVCTSSTSISATQ